MQSLHLQQMEEYTEEKKDGAQVILRPLGPLVVSGDFEVTDEEGKVLERKERMSFCRCKLSSKWPFCDGSHKAMQ